MDRLRGLQWGALALVTLTVSACRAAYGPANLLCRFADSDIDESSGIAASARSDAYFFTHNDSGDKSRFFAVDLQGRTLATFNLPHARNQDWEDMASTRDARGNPVLIFGDIGDNGSRRKTITLYRVPEPIVDTRRTGLKLDAATPERFELRYPDGAHDAETLLADPRGRVFVVTKNPAGSAVYAAPHPLDPDRVNTLRKIGDINFLGLPAQTRRLRDQISRLLATSGAISRDGRRLVVRTYTDAYEWDIPKGHLAAALKAKPRQVRLPAMQQGEAITYSRDGRALLTDSEGDHAPVYRLPAAE